MYYFILPNNTCLRNIPRNGSTALANAILTTFYPDRKTTLAHGAYGTDAGPQGRIPSSPVAKGASYALIRDPVERFQSAYAKLIDATTPAQLRYTGTLDDFIANLSDKSDALFLPQASLIAAQDTLYLFPEQLNDLATVLGLPVPIDPANVSEPGNKPVLTAEQTTLLNRYYADDLALRQDPAGPRTKSGKAAAYYQTLDPAIQAKFAAVFTALSAMTDDKQKALGIAALTTDNEAEAKAKADLSAIFE